MRKSIFLFITLVIIGNVKAQSVGIGTTTPASSAKLDVSSTNQGFLPPRLTYAQRNELQNPVAGLVIWCSDCDELQVYNGTMWKNMSGVAASLPTLPSVRIGSQVWMVKNLDVANYRNGDSIAQVTDPNEWASLTTGAYCYYDNDSATYAATYGKIYNWYAVNDPRGLAPTGWHVPTRSEWKILVKCIDPSADTTISIPSLTAGGAMKEIGISHWTDPNTGATNSSGFTGLPGGSRDLRIYPGSEGVFFNIGLFGGWWSSTYDDTYTWIGYYMTLDWGNSATTMKVHDKSPTGSMAKYFGISVRCIKD